MLNKVPKGVDLTYITPENIKYHKLSDILASTIEDIKSVCKAGFGIDMGSWVNTANWDLDKRCTVCLGGACLLGFMEPPPSIKPFLDQIGYGSKVDMYDAIEVVIGKKQKDRTEPVYELMSMLNQYRSKDGYGTAIRWLYSIQGRTDLNLGKDRETITNILERRSHRYCGILKKDKIAKLIVQMRFHVRELRKAGF